MARNRPPNLPGFTGLGMPMESSAFPSYPRAGARGPIGESPEEPETMEEMGDEDYDQAEDFEDDELDEESEEEDGAGDKAPSFVAGFRRAGETCGACRWYEAGAGTCQQVAGTDIKAQDTCGKYFVPAGSSGKFGEPGYEEIGETA